jgi:hypothetical protein
MPLTGFHLFLYVKDESAGRLQNPKELLTLREKPFYIFTRFNPSISLLPTVSIWR